MLKAETIANTHSHRLTHTHTLTDTYVFRDIHTDTFTDKCRETQSQTQTAIAA